MACTHAVFSGQLGDHFFVQQIQHANFANFAFNELRRHEDVSGKKLYFLLFKVNALA